MDLLGRQFGRLTVLDTYYREGLLYCHCICECGNEKDVYYRSLIKGATKSCGCLAKEITHKIRFDDLVGRRFDKLQVVEYLGYDGTQTRYRCLCDCGNTVDVSRAALVGGYTRSCGCIMKEKKINRLDEKLNRWYGELYTIRVIDYNERHPHIESVCKEGHINVHRDSFYSSSSTCGICSRIKSYKDKYVGKFFGGRLVEDVVFDNNEYKFICGQDSLTLGELKAKKFRDVNVGDIFGRLTVIEVFKENNKTYCRCRCSCGNELVIRKGQIYSRRSCGCRMSLIGKNFGRWHVIDYDDTSGKWKCQCSCGNMGYVTTGDLNSGHSKSCGCLAREMASLNSRRDLVGQRFGKLVVVDREVVDDYRVGKYRCKCECGNIAYVNSDNLLQGHVKSCDCLSPSKEGSLSELEIKEFIEQESGRKFIKVKILDGKEIDMYNDDLKLGIEYNGSYFHASINNVFEDKPKDYHRDKFLLAKEKGIHLINIFDVDWESNKEKIKIYLRDIVARKCVLYARKCQVVEISKDCAKEFLSRNHLQGYYNLCSINYGLFYNDELYSVMSFGKLRMSHTEEGQYELHRYAVKSGYTIVGGAEKLFSAFIRNYNPNYIRSYSDNDYFVGSIYEKLGFNYSGQADQRYYWVKSGKELKREKCKLKYLAKQYPELYEEAIEGKAKNKETYIMNKLNAQKVYRSGNTRWEWLKS